MISASAAYKQLLNRMGGNQNPKYGEIEEILDTVEKRFKQFKNFDIINKAKAPSHLLSSSYYGYGCGYKIKNRRIAQEHTLLEEKLPPSIFVRAYGTHVDFFRAAIVGPPNTPYAHALFFFDILIPKSYPSSPPKISYTSCYDSDSTKVNLKILESWYVGIINRLFGSKEERWDPKTTILDLLLLIQQSLSKHIPPFEHHSSCLSNHNQRDNDKMVWLSTCEGMMHTLEKPPQGFEDLVRGHFRNSAHHILMLFRDTHFKDETDQRVITIFYKLLMAFTANGTYCNHHLGQVGQMTKSARIHDQHG